MVKRLRPADCRSGQRPARGSFAPARVAVGRRPLRFEPLELRQMLHGADVLGAALVAGDGAGAEPAPDFALVDVNPTSTTHNQTVSPRDYVQQVSAWYFGHST